MKGKEPKLRAVSGVALVLVRVIQAVLFVCAICVSFFSASGWQDAQGIINGIAGLVVFGGFAAAMFPLGRMLKGLKAERTPFTDQNVRRLKTMVLVFSLQALVQLLFDWFAPSGMKIHMIPIPLEILSLGFFRLLSASSLIFLVFALVMYCIALVFRQGVALQTQSDETL